MALLRATQHQGRNSPICFNEDEFHDVLGNFQHPTQVPGTSYYLRVHNSILEIEIYPILQSEDTRALIDQRTGERTRTHLSLSRNKCVRW